MHDQVDTMLAAAPRNNHHVALDLPRLRWDRLPGHRQLVGVAAGVNLGEAGRGRRGGVAMAAQRDSAPGGRRLRSQEWFDNPDNPGMTALYLERYLNYGLTRAELQSGKPMIGIAQTGSDLVALQPPSPRAGQARARGHPGRPAASPFEFPCHPIQETGKRPTAVARPQPRLSRAGRGALRLSARRRGADHRLRQDHAGLLMAAATVNIPAIALSVGPMLNGWHKGERTGSGTIVWKARELLAAGEIDYDEFMDIVASSAPSVGYCNTMGTATTMNSLAEALGMQLPGSRRHSRAAIASAARSPTRPGKRIVEMVHEDLQAVRHHDARGVRERHRRQLGDRRLDQRADPPQRHRPPSRASSSTMDDWQRLGHEIPLLVNLQPAGEYPRRGLSTAPAACRRWCTS